MSGAGPHSGPAGATARRLREKNRVQGRGDRVGIPP